MNYIIHTDTEFMNFYPIFDYKEKLEYYKLVKDCLKKDKCNENKDYMIHILSCIWEADKKDIVFLKKVLRRYDFSKDVRFQLAIIAGDVEIVDMLLRQGVSADIGFHELRTPLHLTCFPLYEDETLKVEIAKLLLEHGANINAVENLKKDTPLILSMKYKFLKLTKFLLSNGSDKHHLNIDSETAFHIAFSKFSGMNMIELLYDDGLDLNKKDIEGFSVYYYAVENLLMSDYDSYKKLEPILFLLKHGVSINSALDKEDTKLIHVICESRSLQAMIIFLNHGAEINSRNANGWTPLHFCVSNQSLDIIESVISLGADINAITKNEGLSMIHCAARNKDPKVLESFIRRGFNVNAKRKGLNLTPLLYAAKYNMHKNVELLLENQANVDDKILFNRTGLDFAIYRDNKVLIDIFCDYGADLNLVSNGCTTFNRYVNHLSFECKNKDGINAVKPKKGALGILIKHMAELIFLGFYVSDQNLQRLNTDLFKDYFKECTNELNLMKSTKIIDDITVFDIFTSRKKLLTLMRNNVSMRKLKRNKYNKKFSIYYDNLKRRIKSTLKRFNLLKKSEENLYQILQNVSILWTSVFLPSFVVDQILNYLNITDLINLSIIFKFPGYSNNN